MDNRSRVVKEDWKLTNISCALRVLHFWPLVCQTEPLTSQAMRSCSVWSGQLFKSVVVQTKSLKCIWFDKPPLLHLPMAKMADLFAADNLIRFRIRSSSCPNKSSSLWLIFLCYIMNANLGNHPFFFLFVCRVEDPRSDDQRVAAAGGGLPRPGGLLVPVCRLESPGNLQEPQGNCPDRL